MIGLLLAALLAPSFVARAEGPSGAGQEPEKVTESKRCMECHEAAAADWKTSIHAAKGTDCIGCHRTDSIDTKKNKPHLYTAEFLKGWKQVEKVKWTDTPNMCKQCHKGVFDEFEKSQHFNEWKDFDGELGSRSFKGCLSCHAFHKTTPARRGDILKSSEMGCSKCHKPKSKQIPAMTAYVEAADALERVIAKLDASMHEPIPGLSWATERVARERGAQKLQELRTGQHHADLEVLKKFAEELGEASAAVEKASSNTGTKKQSLASQKKLGLGLFLGAMLITLLLTRSWCIRTFGWH